MRFQAPLRHPRPPQEAAEQRSLSAATRKQLKELNNFSGGGGGNLKACLHRFDNPRMVPLPSKMFSWETEQITDEIGAIPAENGEFKPDDRNCRYNCVPRSEDNASYSNESNLMMNVRSCVRQAIRNFVYLKLENNLKLKRLYLCVDVSLQMAHYEQ